MNNIVDMVSYYLLHKNADDSVIEYLKNKLNNSCIDELIIIQIELLYTDPSDKLVNELVNYINNKINEILSNITLYELASLICILKIKIKYIEECIEEKHIVNNDIFSIIKSKDINKDNVFDEKDQALATNLINESQDNEFEIKRNNSEIKSLKIWLLNLEHSYNKKLNNVKLNDLIDSYVSSLILINRDEYINEYIDKLSRKIDEAILKKNVLDLITSVMPELDYLYKNNYNIKNEQYKLLDYYIEVVENKIKNSINNMDYEERLLLKDKINIICKEILENDNPDDDFKVQVIKSYIRYL